MRKFRAWDENGKRYEGSEVCLIGELVIKSGYSATRWEEEAQLFNLCQSTGLKDKNGVEIFEGDILYFDPYETHSNDRVVEYIDGAYRGRLIRNGYSKLLAECVYETKVIGNIYENPELLEVAE